MSLLVAGNNPAAVKTAERNIFTATASQTTFTITQGYQAGDIDVYLNGVRLVDTEDYVANNGTTVVLNSGAAVGDSVVVVCFRPFQVADFYTKSEQDTRYVNATGDTITGDLITSGTTLKNRITDGTRYLTMGQWDGVTNRIESSGADILIIQYGSTNLMRFQHASVGDFLIGDSAGRVRMPYQPSFRVAMNGSPTTTNGTTLLWDLIGHNVGSHYSSATGRFTAPISGKYFISHGIRFNANGSAYTQSTLAINGVNAPGGLYANATVTGATYSTPQWNGILNLNAGDYLTVSGAFSGGTGVYSGAESWFSGHLIG
jgi:hypothetical protein